MGKVILLTGAPATGKSTLRRNLVQSIPNLCAFDYGKLLLAQKSKQGMPIEYEELRKRSAAIIAPKDVKDLDEMMISEIANLRKEAHVIIDSHAVTREVYGFRAIPFSLSQLNRLGLDAVLTLRCRPEVVIKRIAAKTEGRPVLTAELAWEHQLLQENVGMTYGIASGCPVFIIDTSDIKGQEVADIAAAILTNMGMGT